MKIAILTQPLKSNYGGILQAFALQRTLKSLGHDAVTIDRQLNTKSNFRQTLSFLKYLVLRIISDSTPVRFNARQQNVIFENTLNFIDQHIQRSQRISSNREMKKHFSENKYEAIVVGSDQTWRPMYSPNIFNFFLDFLENNHTKRIAYASSFGVDEWEYSKYQAEQCRDLAKKFDAVSVREQSGVNLCKQYLDTHAEFVLDPTLLLTANDYIKQFCISAGKVQQKGLFTYILDNNDDKKISIDKVCKSLSLTAFSNQPDISLKQGGSKTVDDYVYPKVETWIKAVHDAEFVITDSFHGCVFSIIFNKPFLAIGNQDRGQARFDSLLNLFKLNDRLITNSGQISDEKIHQTIDWPAVNRVLEEQRKHSLNFIIENLKDKT
ncbi:polysaccharide pyruvyl transferase family protein [Pseudomonas silesiensis]